MTQNGMLSKKQTDLLTALLQGQKVEDAARAANVSERTAYRMMSEPAFKEAHREALRQVVAKALAKLQMASEVAANVLVSNLQADTGTHSALRRVQVQTAALVLELAMKSGQLAVLEERLSELEQLLGQREGIAISYGRNRLRSIN